MPAAGFLLAHPITQPHVLAIPPLLAGVLAGLFVFSMALVLRARPKPAVADADPEAVPTPAPAPVVGPVSWAGRLTPAQVVTRCLAVAVLLLGVTAGRFGVDDELENIAPALVVGVLWPTVVLASALVGGVWRWLDPWDALARLLAGFASVEDAADRPVAHVWPAVGVAGVLVWYLSAYADPLDPRAVGAALAVYTVVTVAGCLALGRARWLSSTEPIGIVLTWTSLLPRRRLTSWQPPHGAVALLGLLAGGLLFGLVRRSVLWGGLGGSAHPTLVATVGLVVSCGVVAGVLVLLGRLTRDPDAAAGVGRACVPALAGVVLAVALSRNRFTNSAELLPSMVGDPYGAGWNPLRLAAPELEPPLLGTTGLLVTQLVVLLAGCLAGAVVLARGLPAQSRTAGAVALALLTALAVTIVAAH